MFVGINDSLKQKTTSATSTNSNTVSKNDATPQHLTHLTSTGTAHMVHIPPPHDPASASASNGAISPSTNDTTDGAPTIKAPTTRHAIARSILIFSSPGTTELIHSASLKKGDVLSVARIAGIMAAKKTADLIPLCHNIPLSGVSVDVELVMPGNAAAAATPRPVSNRSKEDSEPAATGSTSHGKLYSQGEYVSPTPSSSPARSHSIGPASQERVGPYGGLVITASVRCFGQTGVEMEALCAATVAALTAYDMCKAVDRGMKVEGTRVVLKEGGRSGTWVEGEGVEEVG